MAGRNGWSELTLREAGVSLIDCVHKTPPAAESGYPYVAIPQMEAGRVELDGVRRITKEHFVEWTQKALPQTNDVILSRRCNPGETAYVDAGLECALGQNLVLLRSDGTKVYPPFLRWLVRGRHWWNQVGAFINVGAVFESLKCADIPNFQLPLPPLSEQKAIAEILGALDAKIELNRRMNETLETLARSLFKSWFVDFDPVRAKMDGRPPPGLPPATAALFPDSFEHQNGSLIPSGWKSKSIGDLADIKHGFAFKGEFFRTESTPDVLLTPGNFSIGGGFKGDKFKYYEGPVPEDFVLRVGDLLVTMTDLSKMGDTLGYPALVPSACGTRFLHNQRLGKVLLKGDTDVGLAFLYQTLCLPTYRHHVLGSATGSTVKHTSPDRIKSFELPVPDKRVAAAFEESALSFQTRIVANMNESETLAALRDTLLPRLLSGELRVAAAGRSVNADTHASDTTASDAGSNCREPRSLAPAAIVSPASQSTASSATHTDDIPAPLDNDEHDATADDQDFVPVTRQQNTISDFDTDEVMAAFRQALRGRGTLTREELLKDVSVRLGFQRLGTTIREALKGHLRAAIRRKIVGTDGPDNVFAETTKTADYTRDELIQFLCSVIGRGGSVEREDAIYAVAHHLGFRRVSNTVTDAIKSAINGAIRRGLFGYEGSLLWRDD